MTTPAATRSAAVLTPRAAAVGLAILTAINLFNYLDRNVVPGVEEMFKPELGLSDTQVGLLASSFTWVYMLVSPWFGTLGDRTSRTRLIAIGVLLWSLATASAGLAVGFASMFVARAMVGVGEAAYGTIGPTLLSDYYPRHQRGRVFAVFYSAIPIGSALGYMLGGWVGHHHGWRSAFFVAGLPGVLLALLAMTLRDPPRGQQDEGDVVSHGPVAGGWRSYLALARNGRYRLVVLGYAAYTFAIGGLQYWGPPFLVRERGMTPASAAIWFGALLALAGFLGTFTGGWLGDVLLRRWREAYLWVSGTAALLAVPVGFLALTATEPRVFLPALFFAAALVFMSTGPINTAIVNVVPPSMRAAAMAGSILAIHLLGDSISPPLIGYLSDESSLGRALLLVPAALLVGAAIWLWGAWRGERAPSGVGQA